MRKKTVHWILVIIAVISLVELVFNWSALFTYNSKSIKWIAPSLAMENDEGTLCVVDNESKRATILNPDKTVRATISANFLSKVSPGYISDITLNDRFIYISDKVLSINGTAITSERILKYDLDGKYISTPYSEKNPPVNYHGDIQDVVTYHDTLFILKISKDSVLAFRIDEETSKADTVIKCTLEGNPVQFASYQPEANAISAYTFNGKTFIYRDGTLERVNLSNPEEHIANLVLTSDNSKYINDSYNGNIIRQAQDSTESIICGADATWLCHNSPSGEIKHLFACDYSDESVISVSVPDHEVSVITEGKVSTRHLFTWYRTLVSASFLALILLYFLSVFIRKTVSHYFSSVRTKEQEEKDGVIKLSELYGKPAAFTFISFLATALFLSVSYYKTMVDNAVLQATNIATSISSLSDETFGDALNRINSAEDYENPDYKYATGFCSSFCNGEKTKGFDLAYKLFRFDVKTGEPTYIYDCTGINVCGTKILKKRMIHRGTYGFVNSVFNGNNETFEYKTSSGVDIFYAMSPLFDSSENLVGAILVVIDLKAVSSYAIEIIINLLLEILTLLAVILLALVELRLLRDFLKIRKNRIVEYGKDITICEGHRTLKILSNIPLFLLIPFISPYAKGLVVESGISGDPVFLSALPLSLSGLTLAVGSLFTSIFTKRNPKRYLQIFNILKIGLAAALLLNIYFKNYYLLVVVFVGFGLISAISSSCYKAIRFCDLKPDKKYDKLVFTNLETPISVSIGTALGALIYDSLGYSAVLAVFIAITIFTMILTRMFIGSDINISKKKELEMEQLNGAGDEKTSLNLVLQYLRRPEVIGCILFVSIPCSFFSPFSSYMLPMLNESMGYPALIVGFLTLLTKTLAMMISPAIISKMKEMKFSISFLICMVSVAFMFFSFAYQPTMFIFSILLFVMGIFSPVFSTQIENFQIASAKDGKIIPNDVHGVFSLATSIGEFAGPICIAALISISNVAAGFVSGAVCLACVAGILLTFKKK